jgi:hypothetical protein
VFSDLEVLATYATPGLMTDPGPYASSFDALPRDVGDLVKAVQGVMLHIFWVERYGVALSEERKGEVQLRRADQKLARLFELDGRPLNEARVHERKLVGNCRDFSVMTAAVLRHQGVPARARCGFGTYFIPDHYEDHWVAEYWHAGEERWVLVDAQLDGLMQEVLKLDFDPLDVPRDRFIVGGKAWQLCRSGQVDPDSFGIFDMHGLWFVQGNLIRDALAFSKVELLPWDHGWGYLTEAGGAEAALRVMDHLAALTLEDDAAFAEIRALTEEDPGLADIVAAVTDLEASSC